MIPKTAIKLTPYKWKRLVQEVFDRDGCCQLCGNARRDQLVPHHIIPKGRLRLDVEWNILTLCSFCHSRLHDDLLQVSVDDLIEQYGVMERLRKGA